jgi:hypothetical protein
MASKMKPPTGLNASGKALWADVTGKYDLRSDELRVLEAAAFEADLIDTMQAAMGGAPLMVRGSMGQEVMNPIVSELRQHRATLATLLKQLKLPDDSEQAAGERSASARAAANARWSRRGA